MSRSSPTERSTRGRLIPLVILVFRPIFGGSEVLTWFVISKDAPSGTAERKSCTIISRRVGGSTGRTQGISAGGVNERSVLPGSKLREGNSGG